VIAGILTAATGRRYRDFASNLERKIPGFGQLPLFKQGIKTAV